MVSFPGCKINLGLQVLARRPDGFHDISTCYYPLPWTDVLEVLPSDTWSFQQTGLPVPGNPDDNLCVRAYHILKKDFSLPTVKMCLHKIVPMGAGLGGGSADGAHTLRLLNSVFQLHINEHQLASAAAKLGSDCAFFTQDKVSLGSGRGDVLEPMDVVLKGHFMVVIVPPVQIATADAYRGVVPRERKEDLHTILGQPVTAWKERLYNDFETSVFGIYPELDGIKKKLYGLGAIYASMSGSGSSVFGIYDKAIPVGESFPGLGSWSGWL